MDLRIYVLNVGKGNCVVVPFPSGRLSVVDIDDSHIPDEEELVEDISGVKKMPLTHPVDWICDQFPNDDVFRFILTHPDMDHMSGLSRLSDEKPIKNFWSVANTKEMSEGDFENGPYSYEDWVAYKNYKAGLKGNTALGPLREHTSDCCWVQDGIRILSPDKAIVDQANEEEEYNHASYVLSIRHENGRRVILGGDASREALDNTAAYYKTSYDKQAFDRLRGSVVVAPHHGSKNNTSKGFMDAVSPDAVVAPVQWGADYDRDFYRTYGEVFPTKTSGLICIEMRGNEKREVAIWTEKSRSWKVIRKDK